MSDSPQLGLFDTTADEPGKPSLLEQRLADINPDDHTPKQALDILYDLKQTLLNQDSLK